jgi:hypothetical protein
MMNKYFFCFVSVIAFFSVEANARPNWLKVRFCEVVASYECGACVGNAGPFTRCMNKDWVRLESECPELKSLGSSPTPQQIQSAASSCSRGKLPSASAPAVQKN